MSRNALCPGPHPGSEIPLRFPCAPSWLPCKVRSIPIGAGGKKRSTVGGGASSRGWGREKAERQLQMEPTGEHFSEERTLPEPGVLSADGDGMHIHLQSITGRGTGE